MALKTYITEVASVYQIQGGSAKVCGTSNLAPWGTARGVSEDARDGGMGHSCYGAAHEWKVTLCWWFGTCFFPFSWECHHPN